jgi:hypothetical protein
MGHLQSQILVILEFNIAGEADRNMTAELCFTNTFNEDAVGGAGEGEED